MCLTSSWVGFKLDLDLMCRWPLSASNTLVSKYIHWRTEPDQVSVPPARLPGNGEVWDQGLNLRSSETFCFLPLWLAITRPVGEQVDLPSWGQAAEKMRKRPGRAFKKALPGLSPHAAGSSMGLPALRVDRDPLLIFSLFIGRIKFGTVIFKKKNPVKLLRFGFQYFFIFQTFLVCLKLPWNILVLCNIFKLWKQKISIAQRAKESLDKNI